MPEGESVADWLIDISSGQLAPDEDGVKEAKAEAIKRKSGKILIGDASKGSEGHGPAVSTMQEDEYDVQALRRDELNKAWIEYFDKKNKNITKKSRQMYYSKPPPTELPEPFVKPAFFEQLWIQLNRAVKVGRRNFFYHLVDTFIIVFFGVLVSLMQGPTVLSKDSDPQGIPLKYLVTEDPSLVLSEDNDNFFEQLFSYAMLANEEFRQ